MPDIVLATANARYSHSSLGLRCLLANMADLRDQTKMLEFVLSQSPAQVAESILQCQPKIIGLGVYIWNLELLSQVARIMLTTHPNIRLVLGGLEMADPDNLPDVAELADHVIIGEGEQAFYDLCKALINKQPADRLIQAETLDLHTIQAAYPLYTDSDIQNRHVYVEASRGCPYTCQFCLSGKDPSIRNFPLPDLLEHLDQLWNRGARQFKFVDRSLHLIQGTDLLEYFHQRKDQPGLFLHFEWMPEHLPEKILLLLKGFPPGSIQLEAGVQTYNTQVARRIGRRLNIEKLQANIQTVHTQTQAHLHTDLILGLPGEDLHSMANGFDRLMQLKPHEIQVGILKKLRGTPLAQHDQPWQMVYRSCPPYDVLQTRDVDFLTMQRLKRFARYFDLFFNRANFHRTAAHIWADRSAFWGFLHFSDWLYETSNSTRFSLASQATYLYTYLIQERGMNKDQAASSILEDFHCTGRTKGIPDLIRFRGAPTLSQNQKGSKIRLPDRQARRSKLGKRTPPEGGLPPPETFTETPTKK